MELTLLTNQLQNGYYLRWYFSGWHYWYFLSNGQAIDVEGEEYRSDVGERLTLGDVNLTKAKLHAMRGLWRSTLVQMLTDDGWKACTIVDKSYDFGPADDPAATIEFDLNVWARVGTFSPLVEVKREPVPEPPEPSTINYGLLYNWWATQDQGGGVNIIPATMASEGWGVCSVDACIALLEYADTKAGENLPYLLKTGSGAKLMQSGTQYWLSSNSDSTNIYAYNSRGGAFRQGNDGTFSGNMKSVHVFWATYNSHAYCSFTPNPASMKVIQYPFDNTRGYSVRLLRPATTAEQLLPDGEIDATYTGNDGKVYRCTKIGTQVWIADNLAETKWSNGNYIQGWDADGRVVIADAAWAALTTAAVCVYDNDETYM